MEFETVIGLEVHVQVSSDSKIFCPSSTAYGAPANHHADPVTLGLPGALPVMNEKVVEAALALGIATGSQIRSVNRFARKHYFYPDLPKGYQISQFEEPICERGNVTIKVGDTTRTIGLTRIHMEEDAGKSMHQQATASTYVDLNRAGTPLLEVVTEPDLRSPAEAVAYMKTLHRLVRWIGISDGNMEQGNLRCDANVSLRPLGQTALGTRTEIKNLNSFKFLEKALQFEITRHLKILKGGDSIVQETRLYDPESNTTRSMRGKEGSADYRYFPDPDLPPLHIEDSWVQKVKKDLPLLPDEQEQRFIDDLKLSEYDAGVLCSEKAVTDYFSAVYEQCGNAKASSNWITTELFGQLKRADTDFDSNPVSPEQLASLIKLIDNGTISGKIAKQVFETLFSDGGDPAQIVEEQGLAQNSNEDELAAMIDELIASNDKQWQSLKEGNQKLLGFFVGQVMKQTQGSANPQVVNSLLRKKLES